MDILLDGKSVSIPLPDTASDDEIAAYLQNNHAPSVAGASSSVPPPLELTAGDHLNFAGKALAGAGGKLLNGLTLGNTANIYGAANATARSLFDPDVNFNEQRQESATRARDILDDADESAPLASTAAEIAGSVVGPGKLVSGAFKGARTLPAKFGNAGAIGALEGAIYGASNAEGYSNTEPSAAGRILGGLIGAGTGAVTGPVMVGAGAGLGKAVNTVLGQLPQDALNRARDVIRNVTTTDGKPLEQAAAEIDALPQGQRDVSILADMLGPEAKRAARGAAITPGKSSQQARQVLGDRKTSELGRVEDAISQTIDNPADFVRTSDGLIAAKKANADSLYGAAFSGRDVARDELKGAAGNDLTENVLFKAAYRKARDLAALEGETLPEWGEGVPDALSVRTLDWIKRALDDGVDVGESSARGTSREAGRLTRKYKNELLQAVDAASPEYAQARNTFAGDAAMEGALDDGLNFTKEKKWEQLGKKMSELTEGEKGMFRLGVARGLQQIASDSAAGANSAKAIFRNKTRRRQLEAVLEPAQMQRLEQALDAEINMQNTSNFVLGGSPTTEKLADVKRGRRQIFTDDEIASATAGSGGVAATAVRAALRAYRNRQDTKGLGISDSDVAEQIGKLVFSADPAERRAAIALFNEVEAPTAGQRVSDAFASGTAAGPVGLIPDLHTN